MVPEVQLVEKKKAWGEGWGSAPPPQLFPFSEKHFLDQPTPTKLQTLSPITFPHVILLHSMDLNVNLYLFYWLAAYVYFLC